MARKHSRRVQKAFDELSLHIYYGFDMRCQMFENDRALLLVEELLEELGKGATDKLKEDLKHAAVRVHTNEPETAEDDHPDKWSDEEVAKHLEALGVLMHHVNDASEGRRKVKIKDYIGDTYEVHEVRPEETCMLIRDLTSPNPNPFWVNEELIRKGFTVV